MSETLREEVERDIVRGAEELRKRNESFLRRWRTQLDRDREVMRQQSLNRWLEDCARKLGRPLETLQLLGIEETYTLQEAVIRAGELRSTGKFDAFDRGISIAQIAEVERLLTKLAGRIPDEPVFLLRDLSGYFGAIEATSAEVLRSAIRWFDPTGDDPTTIVSAVDQYDGMYLTMNPSSAAGTYVLRVWGPRWGRLLEDEQSDWNFEKQVEQVMRLRANRNNDQY